MSVHKHIILPEQIRKKYDFESPRKGGREPNIPQRNNIQHGQYLNQRLDEVWDQQRSMQQERNAVALPSRDGTYIEFRGQVGYDLVYSSLEDQRAGIRLLNVRDIKTGNGIQQAATVYVPRGKEHRFAQKLVEYQTILTSQNKPSHDKLFRSIEDLNIANLYSMWTDKPNLFPSESITWYEVWIRTLVTEDKGKEQCESFINNLREIGIETKDAFLLFHERAVVLIKGNVNTLSDMIVRYDFLAEFRAASITAGFWCNQSRQSQNEWIQDLLQRMIVEQEHDVLVCLLDTGVNNGHPLLQPLIPNTNCLSSIPSDGTHDVGDGHGTQMAGIIEFENLEEKLETARPVVVSNRICSIKILPNRGRNSPNIYGPITEQSVYRAEVAFPNDRKLYCMAITASNSDKGLPTSWSGEMDQLAYNDGTNSRLLIVSAGNIRFDSSNFPIWNNYPTGSALRPVQDPAQSWNSLTIGAFTEKIASGERPQYGRVASVGELSPFSTTTVNWPSSSPLKPEIVFEGGNLFSTNDLNFPYTTGEEVESLTTNAQFQHRPFTSFSATSLATAIATSKAAQLMRRYPNLWPESIRALMVHSAEWTEGMKRQFPATNKTQLRLRLRSVGYGVPNENRLFNSLDNAMTMIAQGTLQPYIKDGSTSPRMNEMHIIELPWPSELLQDLGEVMTKIKITLSYFIEPGPGEIGWKNKYRYQSCGLRFELNDVNENEESFKQRINKKMRDDENPQFDNADSSRWSIGVNNRDVGSIHSDYIEDTAINLAECKYVAVYPVGGWWKFRTNLKMYNNQLRYSLVVSLETPSQEIDLYSEVINKIENVVNVPVEVRVS